jgi:CheY-like chemotaxis protein
MDGLELAQLLRLRAQCCLTKLVAWTGYTDGTSRLQTDERVFDYHLTKPLSLDNLADALRHL